MASTTNLSSSPFLLFPRLPSQSHLRRPNPSFVSLPSRRRSLRCSSSSNGQPPAGGGGDNDPSSKEVERLIQEKRRAELAARIASGEFTVQQSGWISGVKRGLSKLGPPGKFLEQLLSRLASDAGSLDGEWPEIPQAKGSFSAVGGQAFFIPLYELFLTYGGIFRLTVGPKYVAFMINLFGEASYRLCRKLDAAASDGEDVEMEPLFSRLTLDIIGKAVFNYEFDSLTYDNGIVEAVYALLREAEVRSTSPIPTWKIPIWKDMYLPTTEEGHRSS